MQDGTSRSPDNRAETAFARGDAFAPDCPTRRLLDRVGDKWSVLVLLLLGEDAMRFNALRRRIGGISQKMLSQTLRALERDGLVSREVMASQPVSVTYRIEPMGSALLDALRAMMDWAETHVAHVAAAQGRYDRRPGDIDVSG